MSGKKDYTCVSDHAYQTGIKACRAVCIAVLISAKYLVSKRIIHRLMVCMRLRLCLKEGIEKVAMHGNTQSQIGKQTG